MLKNALFRDLKKLTDIFETASIYVIIEGGKSVEKKNNLKIVILIENASFPFVFFFILFSTPTVKSWEFFLNGQ